MTDPDAPELAEPPAGRGPEFSSEAALRRSRMMANYSMVGLFVLALLVVLYHIGDFMVPVIGAILLNLILSPVSRAMHRLHIPYSVSAVVIVVVLFSVMAATFYGLSSPVSRWISVIPEAVARLENQLEEMRGPLINVRQATREVEKITSGNDGDQDTGAEPQRVVVSDPSLTTRIFGSVTNMVLEMGLMFVLLYFLLAVGDLFQIKLVSSIPRLRDKLKAQHMATAMVHDMSIYLATVTLINAVLGTAVGLALFAFHFPNPLVWGVMAGLLNYVPYLGAVVGIGIVAVASFMSMEPSAAIWPPLAYAAINTLEGQFITPSIVSRNLTLNPVVVFLSVSFFAWFWGIPGALMAVPILVIVKILSEYITGMEPLGEFLSGRKPKPALPQDPAPTAEHDSIQ